MARKSFRCARCNRSFSMAAHLARHNSTIHGMKSKAKRTTGARRRGRRARIGVRRAGRVMTGRNTGDSAATLISQMQAYHSDLASKRIAIDAEIDAIATAMQALGAGGGRTATGRGARRGRRPGTRGRRRGRPAGGDARSGSLKDYIARVLRQTGKPMSPNEIGSSVMRAGYKTKSKDLTKAVSNTLPQMRNIKRIGFGAYQAG